VAERLAGRPSGQGSDAVLAYEFGFRRYVRAPSEQGLQTAYELGRNAVVQQCSLLDLVIAHHAALLAELRRSPGVDPQGIIDAAADFLLETLSAYEMQSRGFREAHERVRAERRHADMLRRLSSFLADASLVDGAAAETEILALVAEHARELTAAALVTADVHAAADRASLAVSAQAEPAAVPDGAWGAGEWAFALVPRPSERPAGEVLAVSIVGADGDPLGELRAFATAGDRFSAVDRAVLVHLAQMAAAALQRARGSELHAPGATPATARVPRSA
jgi:hypothetical protein